MSHHSSIPVFEDMTVIHKGMLPRGRLVKSDEKFSLILNKHYVLLGMRYGLNQKTVAKWRKRAFVNDARMGPKAPRSTVSSAEEEAIIVALRKHTLLPLDDCGAVAVGRTYLLCASFVWQCLSGSTMTPFPHPAHR